MILKLPQYVKERDKNHMASSTRQLYFYLLMYWGMGDILLKKQK